MHVFRLPDLTSFITHQHYSHYHFAIRHFFIISSTGKIRNRGLEYLESEFPLVDYITQCDVMARNVDFV